MIKPDFTITQDDEFLYIKILVKYVKITNAEFDIEENNFKFYLKPYLLDLYFPHKIVNDQRAKSSYDVQTGTLLCKVPKEQKGQFFPNLDMITTLFKTKQELPTVSSLAEKANPVPLIEVISSTESQPTEEIKAAPGQPMEILVPGPPKYGFNNGYSGVFLHLHEEMHDICDLEIEKIDKGERWGLKTEKEQLEFDYDRYIYDTFLCEEIKDVISLEPPANEEKEQKFSPEEYAALKSLPNKEYLIDNENKLFLQLIDILYAYSYDRRTTGFEFTSESHWTIVKLSSVFSCFCDFAEILSKPTPIKEVLISSYRRVLTYPLYRNFGLCEKVKEDTSNIFLHGKVEILKALLNIKRVFEKTEPKYLLNKIFVDDFAIWVQKVDEAKLFQIGKEIKEAVVKKEEVGLSLEEVEEMYYVAQDKQ